MLTGNAVTSCQYARNQETKHIHKRIVITKNRIIFRSHLFNRELAVKETACIMTPSFLTKLFILAMLFTISIAYYHPYKRCHQRCGMAPWHIAGQCNTYTGRCKCFYGWTGPNSRYLPGTLNEIEADYCTEECHYTHDSRNKTCTYQGTVFVKPPSKVCSALCGQLIYHHAGTCLQDKYRHNNGKCLCWWGWTGPGARYRYDGRIIADYCVLPCHFTQDYQNAVCGITIKEQLSRRRSPYKRYGK